MVEVGCNIMLIQFNFQNHKCFYDKSYIDMTATSEKRHLEDMININGINLLPFLTIYGSNASGKSTIIDAFYFMARAVIRTYDSNILEDFNVVPFIFSRKTVNEPSTFEVFINLSNYEYRYGFSATREGIKEEWLYQKKFVKNTRSKEKMIFEREDNNIVFDSEYNNFIEYISLINNKTLLLSFLGRKGIKIFNEIYNWFYQIDYIRDVVNEDYSLTKSINILYNDKEIYNKFMNIIKEVDPCLKDVEIIEKEGIDQKKYFEVSGKHIGIDAKYEEYHLPLLGESSGIVKLIKILPIIIKSLMVGSLLFVDELDTKLHPLLFKKIVSMYSDKSINKKHAQLIFTTHNTYLLNSNDSRRDQIMFACKNNFGKSKVYSLAEFKKIRCDADYQKKYFEGAFGSIPFIDN